MLNKKKIRWMLLLLLFVVLAFAPQVYVEAEDQLVADGMYKVLSTIDERYVWDISNASIEDGGNLQLWTDNNSNAQKFIFSRQEDGYYIIKNVNSGKAVECAGAGTDNGTNIQQSAPNDGDEQRWELIRTESGNYSFVCKCNGKAADVQNGAAEDGMNMQIYDINHSLAQEFKLLEVTTQAVAEPDAEDGHSQGFYNMAGFLMVAAEAVGIALAGYGYRILRKKKESGSGSKKG